MEFKTLSILKRKPQQSGSLEGLGHSAKVGNGSCDWAEASWGNQGRAREKGRGNLGGKNPHADHLLSPCFPGTLLYPAVLGLHVRVAHLPITEVAISLGVKV